MEQELTQQAVLRHDQLVLEEDLNALFESLYFEMVSSTPKAKKLRKMMAEWLRDKTYPLMTDLLITSSAYLAGSAVSEADARRASREAYGPNGIAYIAMAEWGLRMTNYFVNDYNMHRQAGMSSAEIAEISIGQDNRRRAPYLGGSISKGSARSQNTVQRTNTVQVREYARVEAMSEDKNIIGWQYVARLDSRTTVTCMNLHGRKYYFSDSGDKRIPPQHNNCRSTTIEIYKEGYEPTAEDKEKYAMPAADNYYFDPDTSVNSYFRENPEKAKEYLTPEAYARWAEYERLDRLVDTDFKPKEI